MIKCKSLRVTFFICTVHKSRMLVNYPFQDINKYPHRKRKNQNVYSRYDTHDAIRAIRLNISVYRSVIIFAEEKNNLKAYITTTTFSINPTYKKSINYYGFIKNTIQIMLYITQFKKKLCIFLVFSLFQKQFF